MQFSAALNIFIVKTKLDSTFTNDFKRNEFFRKMSIVTEYAALTPCIRETPKRALFTSSKDPDEMSHNVASSRGPNCLLR